MRGTEENDGAEIGALYFSLHIVRQKVDGIHRIVCTKPGEDFFLQDVAELNFCSAI